MTKQEMAEWLAENVLKWTRNDEKQMWTCPENRIGDAGNELTAVWYSAFERIIYSPDGFFAVWDAVEGDKCVGMEMYIPPDQELRWGAYSCTIRNLDQSAIIKCGEDRYEAFYTAVYQAFNE